MKVAIVSSQAFPDHMGGVESYLFRVVPELAKYAEVLLVSGPRSAGRSRADSGSPDADRVKTVELRGLNLYPMWEVRRHPFPVRLLWHTLDGFSPGIVEPLRKVLVEEEPDVVHTHNVRGLSLLAFRGITVSGVPHVHTLHDHLLLSPLSTLSIGERPLSPSILPNRLYQLYTRSLTDDVRTVVAPSRSVLELHTQSEFFRRSAKVVLPNPSPAIRTRRDGEHRSTKSDGEQPGLSFLFVGTLEGFKGVRILLRAIRDIQATNVRFHIVGGGGMERTVAAQASHDQRIVFHGRVPNDRLDNLYQTCDVLLFLSLWPEVSPMVISEALSYEIPVIATAVGGVPDQVSDRNGWLIPPGSVEALVDIIDGIIREPGIIIEKRSRSPMSESYLSLGDHVRSLLSIYNKILV